MLLKNLVSWGLFSLFLTTLSGCASNEPPQWFNQNVNDTATDYVVVSHGLSMYDAKQKGLMQITQKLSTTVNSSVKIRNAGVTANIDGKESNRTFGYTDISINSTSAKLTLNGIQTLNSTENDSGAYVKLKISKAAVRSQMENELKQYEQQAQAQINALKFQDALEWWIKNRHIEQFVAEVKTRISVLSTVNPDKTYSAPITQKYAKTVSKVKNTILVFISATQADAQKAAYLADFLSQEKIATTRNNYSSATHSIKLTSTYSKNRIGKYYRYTAETNLSVTGKKQNKSIASSKIISTGSSPNSLKMAKTGSSQDFSKKIKTSGLWKSLGFSDK